jgi:hypothetical protein
MSAGHLRGSLAITHFVACSMLHRTLWQSWLGGGLHIGEQGKARSVWQGFLSCSPNTGRSASYLLTKIIEYKQTNNLLTPGG